MNIYRTIDDVPFKGASCVTVGSFDGIHAGHKKIIDKIVSLSGQSGARSVVITFDPIPKRFIKGAKGPLLLTTLSEKLSLIEKMGVDTVFVISFNQKIAKTGAEEFIKSIIVDKIGVQNLVVGHNHTFGSNAQGNHVVLEQLSLKHRFAVTVVEPVEIDNELVSSTRIRQVIKTSDVSRAQELLGHAYLLRGVVVYGKKFGRVLGFPTANIKTQSTEKLIPGNGVYAVKVETKNGMFGAMAYIGNNPTLDGFERSVEVHIHDFSDDLYGSQIDTYFLEKIRNEQKFSTIDELRNQIESDKKRSLSILLKTSRRY